jgi:hypothetical protein
MIRATGDLPSLNFWRQQIYVSSFGLSFISLYKIFRTRIARLICDLSVADMPRLSGQQEALTVTLIIKILENNYSARFAMQKPILHSFLQNKWKVDVDFFTEFENIIHDTPFLRNELYFFWRSDLPLL